MSKYLCEKQDKCDKLIEHLNFEAAKTSNIH